MGARRPRRVPPRAQLVGYSATTPAATERMLETLVESAQRAEQLPRASQVFDLEVGANRVIHNLGRKPIGVAVTPTVADATFAWALTSADERIAIITTVGIDQPKATLDFF